MHETEFVAAMLPHFLSLQIPNNITALHSFFVTLPRIIGNLPSSHKTSSQVVS
jgi:hypothetical protein